MPSVLAIDVRDEDTDATVWPPGDGPVVLYRGDTALFGFTSARDGAPLTLIVRVEAGTADEVRAMLAARNAELSAQGLR